MPDRNASDGAFFLYDATALRKELPQIYRHSLRNEHAECPEDRRGLVLGSGGDGTSSERAAVQNLVDHSGARSPWTHLQENSYAVVVGLLDRLWEVDAMDRLGEEGVCRPILIDVVGLTPRSTVEPHPLGGASVQHMEIAVLLPHGFGDLTVYRGDPLQRVEGTSELLDSFLDRRSLSADHTFVWSVDDEQVRPVDLSQDLAYSLGGRFHHPHGPIHFCIRRDSPDLPCGVTAAGQITHEQFAVRHAPEHLVTLVPGTHGEQAGRFA